MTTIATLTVAETAIRLQVAPKTVLRWIWSGKLGGSLSSRKAGWRVPLSEVDRLAAAPSITIRRRF